MENLLISASTVTPLLLLIGLGMLYRKVSGFDRSLFRNIDKVNFQLFLPVMLFYNIYTADVSQDFSIKLFIFCVGSLCLLSLFWIKVLPFLEIDKPKRGSMYMSLIGRNYIVIGAAIIDSLYGKGRLGPLFLVTMGAIPVVNITSVMLLESYRGERANLGALIKKTLLNPFVLSTLLGFVALICKIRFPAVIDQTMSNISGVATPLALFILGTLLEFSSLKTNWKNIISVILGMLITGTVFICIGLLLGFRGMHLAVIIIFFLAPTSVTSSTLAAQLNGNPPLSAQLILISTVCSVFFFFFSIFICKAFGFF